MGARSKTPSRRETLQPCETIAESRPGQILGLNIGGKKQYVIDGREGRDSNPQLDICLMIQITLFTIRSRGMP